MEIFILVIIGLLALVIITARIKRLLKISQNESEGCCSCKNCSDSSCKEIRH